MDLSQYDEVITNKHILNAIKLFSEFKASHGGEERPNAALTELYLGLLDYYSTYLGSIDYHEEVISVVLHFELDLPLEETGLNENREFECFSQVCGNTPLELVRAIAAEVESYNEDEERIFNVLLQSVIERD